MNPDLFFENFELLANAPNGVQKLRELILQLAVMGKLVEQNTNDEPAEILLERIKDEKDNLVKKGIIKKFEPLPRIKEDEIPYKLPKGWKWVRLEDLVSLLGDGLHGTPKYSDYGEYFFINGNNLNDGKIIIKNDTKRASIDEYEKYKKKLDERTVLVSINGTLGNVAFYNNENIILGKSACYFNLLGTISKFYLKLLLKTSYFLEYAFKNATGTTIKNVSLKSMRLFLVPFPPLAEQKRIVAKVDELMALCDKLESRRQKKQELQSKLNSAALDRMLSAENQEEFEQHWQHICENFDLLYDNSENVEKLKQTILQLAVQGKLVEQDPEDEPASILIEKIRNENKLERKKKINISEQFSKRNLDQEIFSIHSNWSWCRFEEIATIQSNLVSPANYPDLPHIAPNNIEKGTGKLLEYTTVAKDEVTSPKHYFYPRQLLYSKIRPNLSKVVIVNFEGLCSADMYPIKSHIDIKYLHLYILSETFLMQVLGNDNRVAMPKVNQQQLSNVLIPLPPLAEQKRIVEKVEQLMGLCDELEAKLRKEREDSEKLLETVVKGLLESVVDEKTELDKHTPMQVAVTQLK
jgi:type I restriction enzyme, S subunit